ncbi:MAG: hypothetical protein CMJ35_14840 [Phycisphaerae bacterium]|nr:hypothetical protein [Phycisphaerae bacterium]MBM92418.1 hypothetical protein [Phycisphaerae bacterium]MBM92864.1 hypothetical protein [Phycisphaerae bacterium]HCT46706.1 hypothetical protein [Phycisphaerales bacterium]|tara:strand:- start:151 stop:729 length:579 start_codon:yes stop_codon:yes gene_type:complete
MSTLNAENARLTQDDRYELATRAQNQQRLNSPRHFIMLGLLLLVIMLIVLGVAWQTRSAAISQNESAARDLVKVQNLIEEINMLQAAQSSGTETDIYEPLPDLYSTLQSLGTRAQLKNDIGIPRDPGSQTQGNVVLKTYKYTINDPSLGHLLDWVKLAEQEIPGMHAQSLKIQPRTQFWNMEVVLARYERRP